MAENKKLQKDQHMLNTVLTIALVFVFSIMASNIMWVITYDSSVVNKDVPGWLTMIISGSLGITITRIVYHISKESEDHVKNTLTEIERIVKIQNDNYLKRIKFNLGQVLLDLTTVNENKDIIIAGTNHWEFAEQIHKQFWKNFRPKSFLLNLVYEEPKKTKPEYIILNSFNIISEIGTRNLFLIKSGILVDYSNEIDIHVLKEIFEICIKKPEINIQNKTCKISDFKSVVMTEKIKKQIESISKVLKNLELN